MVREFREFINRGNLVELAVAFVMGAAFTGVVTTLVQRVINPVLGLAFDVSSLDRLGTFGRVDPATGVADGSIGAFLAAALNFLLVAAVMFFVVKGYNRLQREREAEASRPEPAPSEEVVLLRQIRDALQR